MSGEVRRCCTVTASFNSVVSALRRLTNSPVRVTCSHAMTHHSTQPTIPSAQPQQATAQPQHNTHKSKQSDRLVWLMLDWEWERRKKEEAEADVCSNTYIKERYFALQDRSKQLLSQTRYHLLTGQHKCPSAKEREDCTNQYQYTQTMQTKTKS